MNATGKIIRSGVESIGVGPRGVRTRKRVGCSTGSWWKILQVSTVDTTEITLTIVNGDSTNCERVAVDGYCSCRRVNNLNVAETSAWVDNDHRVGLGGASAETLAVLQYQKGQWTHSWGEGEHCNQPSTGYPVHWDRVHLAANIDSLIYRNSIWCSYLRQLKQWVNCESIFVKKRQLTGDIVSVELKERSREFLCTTG